MGIKSTQFRRLDGNDELDVILEAPALPVKAGALAYIEVDNLHVPPCIGVFARNEA
jgi:hypothetical protein